jgi:hypothetical protein
MTLTVRKSSSPKRVRRRRKKDDSVRPSWASWRAAKLKLEHYYQKQVQEAIERNTRRTQLEKQLAGDHSILDEADLSERALADDLDGAEVVEP